MVVLPARPGVRSHLCSYIVLTPVFLFSFKASSSSNLAVNKYPGKILEINFCFRESLKLGKSLISVWIRNAFFVSLNGPRRRDSIVGWI